MTGLKLSKLAATVATAALLVTGALAQGDAKQQPVATAAPVKRLIVVSLEDRKLALVEDGQVKKIYTVAVGKPSTPSPVGTFTIERRVANPTYHHDGKTVLPGPGNPVGTRWMGLSIHGYGIHGTNQPNSIGKAASHGCIRMSQADLEEFYDMVAVGDTVELVGQRNARDRATIRRWPESPCSRRTAYSDRDSSEPSSNPSICRRQQYPECRIRKSGSLRNRGPAGFPLSEACHEPAE